MTITTTHIPTPALRFSLTNDSGTEIGHAYLYIITNHHHDRPYALLENLEVDAAYRGQGLGKQLIQHVIQTAREHNCYKVLATSRYSNTLAHQIYLKFGFTDHGKEFRLDLA